MTADKSDRESIQVLHLTDPHLFADPSGELRGTVTADSLRRVLDHYQSGDWRAERVLITGDLIQDDSPEAYKRFRDALGPLNLRMHCVPGNHDVRELMIEACQRPPFSYCATEQVREWLLVGLDSCISGEAGGEVADDELARFDEVVAASSARHVMVFVHHPPIAVGSAWLDSVGMKNGEALLKRLQSANRVRLLVFGHVHQPYDAEHDGIQIIGTPSTCRQFASGSDDFAVDDRAPAYRRIILHSDGSVETELIWVERE